MTHRTFNDVVLERNVMNVLQMPTRRSVTRSLVLALPALSLSQLAGYAQLQPQLSPDFPAQDWGNWEKPEAAGYRSSTLESVEQTLFKSPTTSMMVVVSGKVLYRYGEISQVSYLASARKSILSMLYGKYVANGTINLDVTIGELGIEEADGLTRARRRACSKASRGDRRDYDSFDSCGRGCDADHPYRFLNWRRSRRVRPRSKSQSAPKRHRCWVSACRNNREAP
jgi:hypothetical protein